MPKATSLGRLILKVYPQQDFDDQDYSYALVTITKDFVTEALRAIREFKKLERQYPKLEYLAFYSSDVDLVGYFDPGDVYGPWADDFETHEYLLEPSSFVPVKHDIARIGTSLAKVSGRGVYFYVVPKHHDVSLETSTIMTESLEEWAKALGIKHRRSRGTRVAVP